jgi:hypothetical protein
MSRSGVMIPGETRHLASVRQSGGRRVIAAARNNAPIQFLRPVR